MLDVVRFAEQFGGILVLETPINSQLDKLFDEWEKARSIDGDFVRDGIIDEDLWCKSAKILFLLKDRNLNDVQRKRLPIEEQIDFRIACKRGSWRVLGQWAYGLQKAIKGDFSTFKDANANHVEAFHSSAVLNLKKKAGKARANINEILSATRNDKDFILRQLDIIKPQIIVCCGRGELSVFEIARQNLLGSGQSNSEFPTKDAEGRVWIDFYHPSCFKAPDYLFNSLLLKLKEKPDDVPRGEVK